MLLRHPFTGDHPFAGKNSEFESSSRCIPRDAPMAFERAPDMHHIVDHCVDG
jgi:hypothetical protein